MGGGSNAIGIFVPFTGDPEVALVGVEAAGEGIETGRHGAPLTLGGRGGVLHGAYSAIMQDEDGQILEAHSVSAGLDYPGTGPEHAWLRDSGRARYVAVTDADGQITEAHSVSAGLDYPGSGPEHAWLRDSGRARYDAVTDAQALAAFRRLAELEGIIPALESSHAVAWVLANPDGPSDALDLICLSGRGDKDLGEVLERLG